MFAPLVYGVEKADTNPATEAVKEAPKSESAMQVQVEKININTATETELMKLPGIGQTTAKRIIEYRDAQGGFKNVEDLMKVKGISKKKFNKIMNKVTVGEGEKK